MTGFPPPIEAFEGMLRGNDGVGASPRMLPLEAMPHGFPSPSGNKADPTWRMPVGLSVMRWTPPEKDP